MFGVDCVSLVEIEAHLYKLQKLILYKISNIGYISISTCFISVNNTCSHSPPTFQGEKWIDLIGYQKAITVNTRRYGHILVS